MIHFMEMKPQPYGIMALRSQEHFWRVPVYKRAMTFVFLIRYVLGYESQGQWKHFSETDMKFNSRSFKRWMEKDSKIFQHSSRLNVLPETFKDSVAHKRRYKSTSDNFSSDSPMKRSFVVQDDSTSEEE